MFRTLYNTLVSHGKAIEEVRNLKQVIVAGANANTNIAISGIKSTDTIVAAIDITTPAILTLPTVTSAGNIQFTGSTAAKNLIITYFSRPLS